jgi:hypothetical protein
VIQDESIFIEVVTIDDQQAIDHTVTRLLGASLAEYYGTKIDDISGEKHFEVIIDGRAWPTFVSQVTLDGSSGIRYVAVYSLPPREQEVDDEIDHAYYYTLERILGQREWQVLPGSLRREQLTATQH